MRQRQAGKVKKKKERKRILLRSERRGKRNKGQREAGKERNEVGKK
jgi:hypothetical protein